MDRNTRIINKNKIKNMGCWSVNCGISNIAINYGQECVILPLIENSTAYGGYVPTTLPIYGVYNDYGSLEQIVDDENTQLLESLLGITISELVTFLVDGKFTYNRSEVEPIIEKLKERGTYSNVENWRFMWINKKVYEFMSVSLDTYSKGNLSFGTPQMLTLLGFSLVEKSDSFTNYDPKRFDQKWTKDNFEIYSDGNNLLTLENQYVYSFGKGDHASIETYFEVPEELHHLKTKNKSEAWRILNPKEQKKILGYVLGDMGYALDLSETLRLLTGLKPSPKTINEHYLNNLDTYGDKLAALTNVQGNFNPMSGRFSPHVLYLTPQCGDYKTHQKILEEFSKINNSYIDQYDE